MPKTKTIITIAHRLSSMIPEKIIVMQDGKVMQEGAHEELIKLMESTKIFIKIYKP